MFLAPSFNTVGFFLIYGKAAALWGPIFMHMSPIRLFTLGVFFLGTHEGESAPVPRAEMDTWDVAGPKMGFTPGHPCGCSAKQ